MKMKNMLIGGMSLALVACISIGGTLAYLSDRTDIVTNTFTMGKGYVDQGLILDETALHNIGTSEDPKLVNPIAISKTERTTQGNQYQEMNIGDVIAKDPTLKLTTGSVDSYVFVRVEGADDMVEKNLYISTDTAENMMKNDTTVNYTDAEHTTGAKKSAFDSKWVKIAEADGNTMVDTSKLDGYYYYKVAEGNLIVTDTTEMNPLFKSVLLPNDLEDVPDLNGANEIKIMGAAVQAHNVDNINAAWDLVKTIDGFAPTTALQ